MSGAQVVDRVWLWCRCKPNAAHHESRPNKIQPQMSTDDANCDVAAIIPASGVRNNIGSYRDNDMLGRGNAAPLRQYPRPRARQ